jgi:glycosyltransferase involved in cell wall biosynthesis
LAPWPGKSSVSLIDTARNSVALSRAVLRGEFDIVHSFSRLAYLTPILPLRIPKVMTYQRPVTVGAVRRGHALSRGTLTFTAISNWMIKPVKHVGRWTMIPNGVPLSTFDYRATTDPEAPLVFLGRLEKIKGPHLAVEIAKRSGRKLVIAGNIPDDKRAWVEANVLSHVDGDRVQYIGPVDDVQKNLLLGGAAAFLMPIIWDEPYGIVMAEAMACGTPVLGLNRGAVPEVVDHGVTGFISDDVDGLVASVARLDELDRAAARMRAENLYCGPVIVAAYEALYLKVLAANQARR